MLTSNSKLEPVVRKRHPPVDKIRAQRVLSSHTGAKCLFTQFNWQDWVIIVIENLGQLLDGCGEVLYLHGYQEISPGDSG